ncbi:MAG: PLP-dependent aspartate aminotransferase family protein [Cyclobacteriaceae bacterium]|nr:PLP-dependent aspartate aminotransferase family protein [Cyclobacteriaceae bacterium]
MKKMALKPDTVCVHTEGYDYGNYKGVTTPIFTATAYEYIGVDKYVYPRYFNTPNISITEKKIAALENIEAAILFSSGMAATMTIFFTLLRSGDHIILQNDIYGGTYDAVKVEMEKMGIKYSFVESTKEGFENAITPQTKAIFFESPSNPLLNITDISVVVQLAKKHQIITIFDNTFGSPINQNPHNLGIDVVMQSGTKYLGGHSDICCGVATMNSELGTKIRETAIHLGGNLDPQSAYLLERSLKTLSLRVKKQTSNALAIAEWLEKQEEIDRVYYPGLKSNPGYDIAKSQMNGFGAMLSFEVKNNPDEFVKKLKLISAVMSLGGVESTVTTPVQTSHARMPAEDREKLGIKPNLIRMSVGIEDVEDLINDLKQAF